MTVYVLEGPRGVVDVFADPDPADTARRHMAARGEWARVRPMDVQEARSADPPGR